MTTIPKVGWHEGLKLLEPVVEPDAQPVQEGSRAANDGAHFPRSFMRLQAHAEPGVSVPVVVDVSEEKLILCLGHDAAGAPGGYPVPDVAPKVVLERSSFIFCQGFVDLFVGEVFGDGAGDVCVAKEDAAS